LVTDAALVMDAPPVGYFPPVPGRTDIVDCEIYLKFKNQDESASQYILESRSAAGWRVTWKSFSKTGR